jgi:electron transfer flavoprotein alpha subunit
MGDVLVVCEHAGHKVKNVTFETLGVARRIAEKTSGSACVLLVGGQVEGLSKALAGYGCSKVYMVDDPNLKKYVPEGYSTAVCKAIETVRPDVVLLGATARGKDLSPRVAAKLGIGLASDCIDVQYDDGLIVTRPIYAGKIISKERVSGNKPYMATIRPKIFPLPVKEEVACEVVKIDAPVDPASIRTRVKEFLKPESTFADVTEADIIVSGGRGLKDKANFKMLEELAKLLGGSVGASRAAVDASWRDHADQVGQTGKIVNPSLYVACGISGAIQHLVGMRTSRCIVAINKDPEAPIFKVADYGVVGDLFQVVPLLEEELKKVCQ